MKKLFTILLVVFLVVFSFVGCEKDKSEEVIQNYEDFEKTKSAMFILGAVSKDLSSSEKTELSKEKITTDTLSDVLYTVEHERKTVTEVLDAKGTIFSEGKVEKGVTSASVKFSGVEIKYKYTTDEEKEPKEGILTLSGTIAYDIKAVSQESTEIHYSYRTSGLAINGVSYKDITLEQSMNKDGFKTTSATVGGKAVDVRLINASVSIF